MKYPRFQSRKQSETSFTVLWIYFKYEDVLILVHFLNTGESLLAGNLNRADLSAIVFEHLLKRLNIFEFLHI